MAAKPVERRDRLQGERLVREQLPGFDRRAVDRCLSLRGERQRDIDLAPVYAAVLLPA
jgi:hypothetical protein